MVVTRDQKERSEAYLKFPVRSIYLLALYFDNREIPETIWLQVSQVEDFVKEFPGTRPTLNEIRVFAASTKQEFTFDPKIVAFGWEHELRHLGWPPKKEKVK